MVVKNKNIIVSGKYHKPILIDVFYDNAIDKLPIVIFCHGYKGFKDWGVWDLVAENFANEGLFFVKFNFSHYGGTVDEPMEFFDLEAFGNNNYVKELDDLHIVLNWVTSTDFEYKQQVQQKDITLIGHSRGGGIVTIKASEDNRISRLVSWASVSNYKNRFPVGEELKLWEKEGVMYVMNGRTNQEMPHYFQFYTSFKENEERLSIIKAANKIKIQHLIVHGMDDLTVSVTEAKQIHEQSVNSELFLVENANHVFGAKHPWKGNNLPKHLEIIVEKTVSFIVF